MQKHSRKTDRTNQNNRSGIRRIMTLNIGTIVFGVLFIYIMITIILYMVTTHIDSYQVTSGPLARNMEYTGVAVYSERIITADASGYPEYYARDNARIRSGGVIYGILPVQAEAQKNPPDKSTLKEIQSRMEAFTRTFSEADFHDVYSLKYSVESALLDSSRTAAPAGTVSIGGGTVCTAPEDGIITYTTDNYQGLDSQNITSDIFDEKSYSISSLKTSGRIEAGDPVYRLIDSEDWSLLIPLTARQIVRLTNTQSIRVKFLKDGITQNAAFTILTTEDGAYYGRLDFSGGLIRYLDNRYIDIELVTNTAIGLKIPVSSIVTKVFFTIPDDYATQSDDGRSIGFLKLTSGRSGESGTVFTTTTIYDHRDGLYFIDNSSFRAGDVLIREGAEKERFIIRDTKELEGVYSMNKGYAVFRRVQIIDKNEEYCIVEKGVPYSISQYDNIVRDSSKVRESQITAH